jgi:hypothetical protein
VRIRGRLVDFNIALAGFAIAGGRMREQEQGAVPAMTSASDESQRPSPTGSTPSRETEDAEELNLDRYVRAIWRAKWLLLAWVLAAGFATWLIASAQPTLYSAVALLEIGRVRREQIQDPNVTREIVNNPAFARDVANNIGMNTDQFMGMLRAETITAGPRRATYAALIKITGQAHDPDTSVRLTRAAAHELIRRHQLIFDEAIAPHLEFEKRVESILTQLKARPDPSLSAALLKIENLLAETREEKSSPFLTGRTRLADAVAPTDVVRPPVRRSVAVACIIAAAIGLLTIGGLAYLKPNSARGPSPAPAEENPW